VMLMEYRVFSPFGWQVDQGLQSEGAFSRLPKPLTHNYRGQAKCQKTGRHPADRSPPCESMMLLAVRALFL
jgi:hypothetical protein